MNQQTSHRQQVSFCKNVDDASHRIVGIGDKKQRPIVLCYVVPHVNPKMACDTTTRWHSISDRKIRVVVSYISDTHNQLTSIELIPRKIDQGQSVWVCPTFHQSPDPWAR